jgi:hypothetical protein
MAAPKIKKKAVESKASPLPRQGTVPCLVLIVLILLFLGFFFFAGLHFTAS